MSTTLQAPSTARYLAVTIFAGQAPPWSTPSDQSAATLSMRGSIASSSMAISATPHCIAGWCAIEPETARDLRLLQRIDGEVEGAPREAVVDVGETEQGPGEDREHEDVHAGGPRGDDPGDLRVRDEGALQDRVVALGRPHPEHVPRRLDPVSLRVAGEEAVNDPRGLRVARVEAVEAEEVPDRREAAEGLPAGEAVAPLDLLGARRREKHGQVVAGLGVPRGEDLAPARRLEDPVAGRVALPPHLPGDAAPVDVHVDGERGRRGVVGEAPGLPAALRRA